MAGAGGLEWLGDLSRCAKGRSDGRAGRVRGASGRGGSGGGTGDRAASEPRDAGWACARRGGPGGGNGAHERGAPSKSAATWTARVVLPVPPFWAISAIVYIASATLPSLSLIPPSG